MNAQRRKARSALALAAARQKKNPDDPAATVAVVELRRNYHVEKLAEHIRTVVDDAPTLTDAQCDRLARLLRPISTAGGGHDDAA